MQRLQAESAARHGVLVESLSGIETVRATGAEARMQTAWERSVAATARSGEDVHFWASLALTIAKHAQQITTLLMMVIGVFLILDGKLTVGALGGLDAGRPRAGADSRHRHGHHTRARRPSSALRVDRPGHVAWNVNDRRSAVTFQDDRAGRIAFENVTFCYPNAPDNALEKVSFKIEPGERVGIIGRVGSGKTTVGRLLRGFYEPRKAAS